MHPDVESRVESRIREVMAGVLEVEPAAIGANFGRDDAALWTSLNHLRLITALEESFDIRFDMREVARMERFESIQQAVAERLSAPCGRG
jgi:acyl carrier protein